MKNKLMFGLISIFLPILLVACGNAENKAQGEWELRYKEFEATKIIVKDDKAQVEYKGVVSEPTHLANVKDNSFEFDIDFDEKKNHAKAYVDDENKELKVKFNNLDKSLKYKKVEN